ncbi:MAG: YceK/YidQ family lipoprotein, partial [Planctomycetota bacterium]
MRRCFALLVAVGLAGCATANQIHDQREGPAVFGGLRYVVATFEADHTSTGDCVMACLDAPFSLALDVALLPFSAINEAYEGGIRVENVEPPPVVRFKHVRRPDARPEDAPLTIRGPEGVPSESEATSEPLGGDGEPTGEEGGDWAEPPSPPVPDADAPPADDLGDLPPADEPPADELGDAPPADDLGDAPPADDLGDAPPADDLG